MVDPLRIEVVYVTPETVFREQLHLPPGALVAQALSASRLAQAYPQALLGEPRIGVFSRAVTLATPLRDGDRVEVYRPLLIDPKEARRQRAQG